MQWLATIPNPARDTSAPGGRRGWRVHAVRATGDEVLAGLRDRRALCGIPARYGWALDLAVEERCRQCLSIVRRARK